ncbi:hypothetical protein PF011_g18060, partial [Phytophthora fragariae]
SAVSEGDLKKVQKRMRYATENDRERGLSEAAYCGLLEVVRYLSDVAGSVLDSVIWEAASFGHVDVVQCLAERCDADMNSKDELGRTALVWAAYRDNTRLAQYLVGQCAVDVSAEALMGGGGG